MIPYGPDDTFATKLVVSVVRNATDEAFALRTWTTSEADVRKDQAVGAEIAAFLREHGVAHTVSSDRILGCPHEEGIDYPMGRTCPRCPFWADKDRFTHERLAPPTATMSAAEVLDALASDDDARRHEALESADALRRELVEPLGAAIERALAHPADASKEEANLFSYGVYLLAKWREPTAYPWIVRWLSLPGEQPFEIGGDIATEDGARILAAVCDGDLEPIKALALDRNANEYAGAPASPRWPFWRRGPRSRGPWSSNSSTGSHGRGSSASRAMSGRVWLWRASRSRRWRSSPPCGARSTRR
jgi:hypothetical protein